MSKTSALLINEPPLQVLPSLAEAIGLNEAMIVQQIHYWLGRSGNEHDGRKWVYKSIPDWQKEFPFWSEDTIGRAIRKLKEDGLLLATDKYNKMPTDRTSWYTIDYDALNKKMPSRQPQIATVEDGKLQPSDDRKLQPSNQRERLLPEKEPAPVKENGNGNKPPAVKEKALHPIIALWEAEIKTPVPGMLILERLENLKDEYGLIKLRAALQIARQRNKTTIAYIEGILRNGGGETKPAPKQPRSEYERYTE